MRFWVCCLLFVTTAALFAEDGIETIDGKSFKGSILSSDNKVVSIKTGDGKTEDVAITDIVGITFDTPPDKAVPPANLIESVAGDSLPSSDITMDEGKITFTSTLTGEQTVIADQLLAVILPPYASTADKVKEQCKERKYFNDSQDMLVVRRPDGHLQSVKGVLKKITDKELLFYFGKADRKMSLDKVSAILLAKLTRLKSIPSGTIHGTDGGVLKINSYGIKGDQLVVNSPVFGDLKISKNLVEQIRFGSDRIKYLHEMEPAGVKEYGFFDVTFNYRKNLSVSGARLKLGGKIYDNGLGVHSFSETTWDIGGKFNFFIATIGIDDAVRPGGNVGVTMIGDGKELIKTGKVTGEDKPRDIRLDVSGVSKLIIRVDFGDDKLGVSDHLDIVNPRLIQ